MTTRGDAHPVTILVVDDDPDDRLLALEAAQESRLHGELRFVEDGEALLEYLRAAAVPGLILLDLNMPRMDGREALRVLKGDPLLRRIPVVVLSTSSAQEDIRASYDLGVNSFIIKPTSFASLVDVMRSLGRYWLETVALPPEARAT